MPLISTFSYKQPAPVSSGVVWRLSPQSRLAQFRPSPLRAGITYDEGVDPSPLFPETPYADYEERHALKALYGPQMSFEALAMGTSDNPSQLARRVVDYLRRMQRMQRIAKRVRID